LYCAPQFGHWNGVTPVTGKALENGAEALLTKPIDFATLRDEIDQWVERAA
jgi:hypothetical protein